MQSDWATLYKNEQKSEYISFMFVIFEIFKTHHIQDEKEPMWSKFIYLFIYLFYRNHLGVTDTMNLTVSL